jgi:hypothetical protein
VSENKASCAGTQSCIWTILRVVDSEGAYEAAEVEPKGAMIGFVQAGVSWQAVGKMSPPARASERRLFNVETEDLLPLFRRF